MRPRRLWLAMQFLTRFPTPSASDFSPRELSSSAAWFPLIGVMVGALVALVVVTLGARHPLLGAALGVLAWTWATGALHLDGLADLADALAASHRDQTHFLAVLRDPHHGTFGLVSIVIALLIKFGGLVELASGAASPLQSWLALPVIAGWARLGPLAWSRSLEPVAGGQGERFAWELTWPPIVLWGALLLVASAAIAPALCIAPLVIAGWAAWLRRRIGGFTGDCLGAGVEVVEVVLLVVVVLVPISLRA